jgi:hypothetical protein
MSNINFYRRITFYNNDETSHLRDKWLISGLEIDKQAWLAARAAIDLEFPYVGLLT